MTYEEKRELRLQISQILADAGLNQKTIKDMVDIEIKNKVHRGFEQALNSLNATCYSGDYIKEKLEAMVHNAYINNNVIERIVKEEIKNRVVKVVLENVELESKD